MSNISNTVLEKYQVRKTGKQKEAFREYVRAFSEERGYACKTEKGSFGAKNIVVGDPDSAKVVYTAHYDTCPVLPFPNFITPKKFSVYLLYNILICLGVFAIAFAAGFLIGFFSGALAALTGLEEAAAYSISRVLLYVFLLTFLLLLLAGPANKHTANDNTSGVVTLLEIMDRLPEELKSDVAFVFFDLEEMGLFGSSGFASRHKKAKKDKLLVNFDCVSDGENILIALKKKAVKYAPHLENSFVSNDFFKVDIRSKGVFYPSDQMHFKCGVGIAALKYSKFFKTEYMDRIHTKKDVIFYEANIDFLANGALKLADELAKSQNID